VRRARRRAAEADLVLWLNDADEATPAVSSAPVWIIRNKIDLAAGHRPSVNGGEGRRRFAISARRGDGLAELMSALVRYAQDYFGATDGGLITRVRQRKLLQEAAASLRQSMAAIDEGEELAAEDLRSAADSLGRLLGQIDVEDVLDVIFREFCIGK
jgi:tRNA modification GTPase